MVEQDQRLRQITVQAVVVAHRLLAAAAHPRQAAMAATARPQAFLEHLQHTQAAVAAQDKAAARAATAVQAVAVQVSLLLTARLARSIPAAAVAVAAKLRLPAS